MNTKTVYTLCILFFTLLLAAYGCSKSDDQRKFEQQALSEPAGITETNASGEVTGTTDGDDWRVGPMYRGLIQIGTGDSQPPFPNPLPYNQSLTVQVNFNVPDPVNALDIRRFRLPSDAQFEQLRYLSQDELSSYNNISLSGSIIAEGPGSEGSGLYRILIYDGKQNLISYGDIEIE